MKLLQSYYCNTDTLQLSKDILGKKIVTNINNQIIEESIKQGNIPVISPLGIDANGNTYNINADTAAGAVAKEIKSRRLLLMTDVEGVINKDQKLISEITPDTAQKMLDEDVI